MSGLASGLLCGSVLKLKLSVQITSNSCAPPILFSGAPQKCLSAPEAPLATSVCMKEHPDLAGPPLLSRSILLYIFIISLLPPLIAWIGSNERGIKRVRIHWQAVRHCLLHSLGLGVMKIHAPNPPLEIFRNCPASCWWYQQGFLAADQKWAMKRMPIISKIKTKDFNSRIILIEEFKFRNPMLGRHSTSSYNSSSAKLYSIAPLSAHN